MKNPFAKPPEMALPADSIIPRPITAMTDQQVWEEYNRNPREPYTIKCLAVGSDPKRPKLAEPFFRREIIRAVLAPGEKGFSTTVNWAGWAGHMRSIWDEQTNAALPEEDHVFEAGLISENMAKLGRQSNNEARRCRDFYQELTIGILPEFPLEDQQRMVKQFSWRRHIVEAFDGRTTAPFGPLYELWSRDAIPEPVKLTATDIAHSFLTASRRRKGKNAPQEETVKDEFKEFTSAVAGRNGLIIKRPQDKALIAKNLEFISRNADLARWPEDHFGDNISISTFLKALTYIEDLKTKDTFVRGQMLPVNKAAVRTFNRETASGIVAMFPHDKELTNALLGVVEQAELDVREWEEHSEEREQAFRERQVDDQRSRARDNELIGRIRPRHTR